MIASDKRTNSNKRISKHSQGEVQLPQDLSWPMYKVQSATQKRFWEKKNLKYFQTSDNNLAFAGILLRLGKNKKTPKGYFYRLYKDGMLSYYKKVIAIL